MSNSKYRVQNWRNYNQALVQRGSITFWLDEEMLKNWHNKARTGMKGRPLEYTDEAITCGLIIKSLFKLPFRMVEGLLQSLVKLLGIDIKVPDYTLLCKRQNKVTINIHKNVSIPSGPLHLLVDSTGLKVFGEGEWKTQKHGGGIEKKRLWRKLHLGIDAQTHLIDSFALTDLGIQDCEGLTELLNETDRDIEAVIGDGAYDRYRCYEEALEHEFELITPPSKNAVPSAELKQVRRDVNPDAFKDRDRAIYDCRANGRKNWKIKSGYHKRSLAETAMFRMKSILGNKLQARTLESQISESAIRCLILNTFTNLGMPATSKI